jgi:C-terminal processing protease CtpA/Prc
VAAKEVASAAATNWMQSVDLPPAWVERPFVIDTNDVFVVGKSEPSASNEAAMTSARNDAIVRIMKQINTELTGSPVGDFVQPRIREDKTAIDGIAARFEKQFATTASPERVDAALRKRDSGIEGFARYHLSKATYNQLVSAYRDTSNVQGMVVARFFPLLESSLHTDGDLVVIGVQKGRPAENLGVRPGDIVLAVGTHPVQTPDGYVKQATDDWSQIPVRGQLAIEMESAGAKRTIKITKPAPAAAP